MHTRLLALAAALVAVVAWSGLGLADDQPGHHTEGQVQAAEHHGFMIGGDNVPRQFFVSKLIGANLWNRQNEKLCEIKDFVANSKSGMIEFAVVSHDRGMSAVPASALTLNWDSQHNKDFLTLDMSRDHFRQAPSFSSSKWPDFSDPTFVSQIDQFYGVTRTATRPSRTD